jgi:hypothetical protein
MFVYCAVCGVLSLAHLLRTMPHIKSIQVGARCWQPSALSLGRAQGAAVAVTFVNSVYVAARIASVLVTASLKAPATACHASRVPKAPTPQPKPSNGIADALRLLLASRPGGSETYLPHAWPEPHTHPLADAVVEPWGSDGRPAVPELRPVLQARFWGALPAEAHASASARSSAAVGTLRDC